MTRRARTLWSDEKREEAQRIVDWLLAAKVENGWPMGPELDVAFLELGESATPKLSRDTAWRLVDALSKTNDTTLDAFERLWNAGRGTGKDADREWRFWLPLRIEASTKLHLPFAVTVLGTRFTLTGADSVYRTLSKRFKEAPEYAAYRRWHQRERPIKTFVTFTARGEKWLTAWGAVGAAWDAFRGLSEFAFGRGRLRIMGGGPRSQVLHPTWLFARAPEQPLQFREFIIAYGDPGPFSSDYTLSEAAAERLRDLAKPMQKEPASGSTLAVVADALRLYAQAMDASEPHGCLLGLWQIAEAVTVAEESRGKTQEVAARLGAFIKWEPVGAGRALDYLGRKRNQIVHHGIHEVEHDEVNIVQLACESAIGWLLRDWKKLPTKLHLREFYRSYTRGDPELAAVTESVAYIRAQRRRPAAEPPLRETRSPSDLQRVIS